jgi:hypothetical protein
MFHVDDGGGLGFFASRAAPKAAISPEKEM